MGYFEDAAALVEHARGELPKIKKAYDESLEAQEVKSYLLVEIKNFLENLRSALDFSARGLFERFGQSPKSDPNIYFPYARLGQSRPDFEKSKRIDTCIPGLTSSRPDIVSILMEIQHFGTKGYRWLPEFMELNNQNKHEKLTPQTRQESKELRIASGGAMISLGEGASISLGHGASIGIGSAVIPGGQVIDVSRPPVVLGPATVNRIRWVSFLFESNGRPVLPFLQTVVDGVAAIVEELRNA